MSEYHPTPDAQGRRPTHGLSTEGKAPAAGPRAAACSCTCTFGGGRTSPLPLAPNWCRAKTPNAQGQKCLRLASTAPCAVTTQVLVRRLRRVQQQTRAPHCAPRPAPVTCICVCVCAATAILSEPATERPLVPTQPATRPPAIPARAPGVQS